MLVKITRLNLLVEEVSFNSNAHSNRCSAGLGRMARQLG